MDSGSGCAGGCEEEVVVFLDGFGEGYALVAELGVLGLEQVERADRKDVHSGSEEAINCLGRALNDRLVFVE